MPDGVKNTGRENAYHVSLMIVSLVALSELSFVATGLFALALGLVVIYGMFYIAIGKMSWLKTDEKQVEHGKEMLKTLPDLFLLFLLVTVVHIIIKVVKHLWFT